MAKGMQVGLAAAFFFATACGSGSPAAAKSQQTPTAQPIAHPTATPAPTATPTTGAQLYYDDQGRVTGWLQQRRLPSGQMAEEYCKMIYSAQDPVINGVFCSADPPTEEAAIQLYELRRQAYNASKNKQQ
ncbi:MAG TPA: hypothetical protein VK066_02175 [Chloroflexota bacterium]|nr:hypothetical protein [Chloroflexota bacterium]